MVLNGGQYVGLVRSDGSFVIHDVPPGSYLLEVHSIELSFQPLRVDVSARDKGKIRVSSPHRRGERLSYPLVLRSSSKNTYFQVRPPFDPWTLIKNPFAIPIILFCVVALCMKMIDPQSLEEARAQMKQQQRRVQQPRS